MQQQLQKLLLFSKRAQRKEAGSSKKRYTGGLSFMDSFQF